VNAVILYLLLLKAVLVSFSGLSSLPVVHHDLVVERRAITERQLNTAVAVARLGPGPLGLYLVCVGYYAGGVPGAVAGCLAMATPAFLVVPLLRRLGRRVHSESLGRVIRAVTLAAAGLLLAATWPLARDAVTTPAHAVVAAASFVVLAFTRLDTFWVIAGSAAAGLALRSLGF
jgi:chromate transporter